MKVLVTGGAGYVGTELVQRLALREDISEITVYDNLSRGNYQSFIGPRSAGHDKLRFIQGDILDSRTLGGVLAGVDLVYHLAAKVTTPFGLSDPNVYEQVNHWGTAELVYAIEKTPSVQLVHLSSTSVYGSSDELVNESSPLRPTSFYAISKQRGEEHVARLVDKGQAVIIRCGNVYGFSPSMRFEAVINKFCFEANFLNRITIHGNGHQSRAFIHVDHLTSVLTELAGSLPLSGTYNLVANNYQIVEIVDALKALRPSLEFIFVDQHLQLRNLAVDTHLALSSVLETSNHKSLKDDLKDLVSHFSHA